MSSVKCCLLILKIVRLMFLFNSYLENEGPSRYLLSEMCLRVVGNFYAVQSYSILALFCGFELRTVEFNVLISIQYLKNVGLYLCFLMGGSDVQVVMFAGP